jgi:hypothetical protein
MQAGNNLFCPNNGWSFQRVGTTFVRYGDFQCRPFSEIGLPASSYTEAGGGPRQCHLACAGSRFSYMWPNVSPSQVDTSSRFRHTVRTVADDIDQHKHLPMRLQ